MKKFFLAMPAVVNVNLNIGVTKYIMYKLLIDLTHLFLYVRSLIVKHIKLR